MKRSYILMAIAPIAMVAACSNEADTVDTEDTAAATTDTGSGTASTDAAAEASAPATPKKLGEAGDFSGTYTLAGADGKTTQVTLDSAAGTYSYTGANGEPMTGRYTVDKDGYRFIINDFYGRPGYFVMSDGALIRLPLDATLQGDDITVTGERYTRDTAQFSREPELGSPVVPEDMVQREGQ